MTNSWSSLRALQRPTAVAGYVGLIVVSLGLTVFEFSTIGERRATVTAEEDMLAQMEGRSPSARKNIGLLFTDAPSGSPFLQGPTVTVAGAALLQRVTAAVSLLGGNVLTSQVDLQKADAKDGWIGLVVTCDIEQASLQQLLYDIEAGMPFLFIDQLVVDAPPVGVASSRTHVLLAVSGQWLGGK
jgi:general secretion pathway protein M